MIYKFTPILKETPWGGSRIRAIKGLPADGSHVGESWEVSGVAGMESVVSEGPEAGLKLSDLIARHGAGLLGSAIVSRFGSEFPILVKIIDAEQWLSVQVHPDDDVAVELEGPGHMGKNEMWHILDAAPGAQLVAGFAPGVTEADYVAAEGTEGLIPLMQKHDATPGRDFYIAAGTIHAIGPGCLIVEVQQSSDITYRVYDYGRPREIHLEKARRSLKVRPDSDIDTPLRHFDIRVIDTVDDVKLPWPGDRFTVAVALEGSCDLDGVELKAGESALLTADHGVATLHPHGHAAILYVTPNP